jgi:hypothetical protein
VIVAAAALVGAAAGIGGGALIARRNNDRLIQSMRKARAQEYRSTAYLEVAIGWHAYLQAVRPLAFPDQGYPSSRPRDLSAVLRSRAQLDAVGSATVQHLHDAALEGAVTLINLLQSLPKAPTGEPDITAGRQSLRAALAAIARQVDLLEEQMDRELHPRTALTEQHVELTGRRGTGQPVMAGVPPEPPPVVQATDPPF